MTTAEAIKVETERYVDACRKVVAYRAGMALATDEGYSANLNTYLMSRAQRRAHIALLTLARLRGSALFLSHAERSADAEAGQ